MSKFNEYNEEEEEFEYWEERLQQYFVVHNIKDEVKVANLITLLGAKTYSTLKTALFPSKPLEKTYDELVKILKQKFKPVTSIIVERFKFYNRKQSSGEKVSDYISVLKELSKSCKFNEFLDQALRDRLVCGVNNVNIQRKLLSEPENLTFEKACEIAISTEAAEAQSLVVQGGVINDLKKLAVKKTNSSSTHHWKKHGEMGKSKEQNVDCFRCGRKCSSQHSPDVCPARSWECFLCRKKGHTSKVCRKPKKLSFQSEGKIRNVEDNTERQEESEDVELGFLGRIFNGSEDSLKVKVLVEKVSFDMEIDSGACKTVMHVKDFKDKLATKCTLKPVHIKLKVVTGQQVKVIGEITGVVEFKSKRYVLPIVIISSSDYFNPLLGRNWLSVISPEWQSKLCTVTEVSQLDVKNSIEEKKACILANEVKEAFPTVFSKTDVVSAISSVEVDLKLRENSSPVFHRAYDMPYALKPKVENELGRLVKMGVLTKVSHSNWASPIVVVPKKGSDSIRICVDFKKTVNPCLEVDHCTLPLPNDIYNALSGNKFFTVLDLSGAYQQLKVRESSQELLTINTHLGLYRYSRLCFGVSSAPGIFQAFMENMLAGLEKTKCYLDDIIIAGSSLIECHKNVIKVMQRLTKYNVKVNLQKCEFYKGSVEFLGHVMDESGIRPSESKLKCIQNTPRPENLTQLKAYLGLLNYYAQFIPMLSTRLKPLYNMCNKGVDFVWDTECENCFELSKKWLTSDLVLTHYSSNLPLFVTSDSSSYGVGAVLSHKVNGEDKPILFASGTLSKTEQNYSQLEKEALAIVFAVKKFHKYLFGREFTLVSDHQPLQYIFGKHKNIPVTAASRIQRWALILSGYRYSIVYKKGSLISNADALSRLPNSESTNVSDTLYSFNLEESVPLSYVDIAKTSQKDVNITKVMELTLKGWPNSVSAEYKPYFSKRNELSVERNCLFWGNKVVVPTSLRESILQLFHEQHLGIVRTKMLLRSYCWWPGINSDVEKLISLCSICQQTQNLKNESSLMSWPSAPNNFYRVHVDFFFKFGYTFLIMVDSKSKWISVKRMKNGTSAKETIFALKECFSVFGLPVQLVSDNGPPFSSNEFVHFCVANGIEPVKSPPYHPQSNGSAERGVQTVKKALEKSVLDCSKSRLTDCLVDSKLLDFLFTYRNTPSSVTGVSPAEAIFRNKPRTRFDLLKPTFASNKSFPNKNCVTECSKFNKIYSVGESVYVKNLHPKSTHNWSPGKIMKVLSINTYLVLVDSFIRHVHGDMLRPMNMCNPCEMPQLPTKNVFTDSSVDKNVISLPSENVSIENNHEPCPNIEASDNVANSPVPPSVTSDTRVSSKKEEPIRRSQRTVRPPKRLNL